MILPDNEQTRIQAAEIIQRGGLIAFRTDTFYGIGADPLNLSAVAKLRQLKRREESKPILVLIADARDVVRFVINRTMSFDRCAKLFWPGPLTLVGKARPELPDELTAGTGTIGVRLPTESTVRAFIRICGGSLTGTSANLSAQPPARSAQEVDSYFPMGIDLILDGGQAVVTEPSTVIDLCGREPVLIREGAISKEQLQATLAELGIPQS
ncbi:MAG TPA: L-threonylcarbamoyladenylate synthase [Pyrinomonadaceae bacterium]|nr:L-threonylcarbamoyladenylate synthase [Pyrinomonadaceae bacterium]